MARNFIGKPPFPPIRLFDEDRPFSTEDLALITNEHPQGVSICIRYPMGPNKRGGYFFHFQQTGSGEVTLFDFEKKKVKVFTADELVRFMNHCTGRAFDARSFNLCQSELNFLQDAQPNA
jgi:hypothetical protein